MLSIRLRRIGKKKHASFRVIVVEKRKDPWGDFLEDLGAVNPHANPRTTTLKNDRILYWISKGAQPTGTVHNMLVEEKIIEAPKVKVGGRKKKTRSEAQGQGETSPSGTTPAASSPSPA